MTLRVFVQSGDFQKQLERVLDDVPVVLMHCSALDLMEVQVMRLLRTAASLNFLRQFRRSVVRSLKGG